MAFFDFFRRTENRADGYVEVEDPLLRALVGGSGEVTREMALQVPAVSGGIDLIANVIAGTPIVLYEEKDGKAEPVKNDRRVFLLNDEPEENMNANQWWHAMLEDYFLSKGGYAWIEKARGGEIRALHYVKSEDVSIIRRVDPLRKDFDIQVAGKVFQPMHFLRILRKSRDGAEGMPITRENSQLINVANQALKLELAMSKRGGNKKGFLKSEKTLTKDAMDDLKAAWKDLYSTGENSAMVLNKGLDFMEVSETSVEMQLNENKKANANEFAKLFHISPETASGKAQDLEGLAKLAAIPVMKSIECALNQSLLREREKGSLYWAFDTKELLKGSLRERMEAYKLAVDANIMQVDEIRFEEDLPALGLNWIKLGLDDVLYDPKTNTVYTPNTNQTAVMGKLQLGGARETEEDLMDDEDN